MWGLGAPGRDDKGEGSGGRGTPGLGWETPEEGGEKPRVGFGGSCQVGEAEEEKRAIKRERRLAVAGESARGEQTQVH